MHDGCSLYIFYQKHGNAVFFIKRRPAYSREPTKSPQPNTSIAQALKTVSISTIITSLIVFIGSAKVETKVIENAAELQNFFATPERSFFCGLLSEGGRETPKLLTCEQKQSPLEKNRLLKQFRFIENTKQMLWKNYSDYFWMSHFTRPF